MLGPAPAWFEDGASNGQLSQFDQLDAGLLDGPYLVGSVEAPRRSCMEPIGYESMQRRRCRGRSAWLVVEEGERDSGEERRDGQVVVG